MQLSQKSKKKFEICFKYLKSRPIFEQFEKKDEPNSWCISEIIDRKKCGYLNA